MYMNAIFVLNIKLEIKCGNIENEREWDSLNEYHKLEKEIFKCQNDSKKSKSLTIPFMSKKSRVKSNSMFYVKTRLKISAIYNNTRILL